MNGEQLEGQALMAMAGTLMFCWDEANGYRTVSGQSGLDLDPGAAVTMDALEALVQEEDRAVFQVFRDKVRTGLEKPGVQERQDCAVRMRQRDGGWSYHLVECYLSAQPRRGITALVRPLTAEEIYRIDLARTVTNDRNPAMFNRTAAEIMASHPERKYAVIQFDVARFKVLNELYGEAFGDELISFFVDSLKVICGREQLYARLSADVFVILTDYRTEQDILDFIATLDFRLLDFKEVPYRLVYGVCCIDDRSISLRKYGDGAAIARQSIKENAMEHIAFYREGMREPMMTDKYIEDRMEQALADGEFVIYLQPKYHIDTGEIVGAEALVRWFSKEKGMMPPMDFIPLFERNGFITKLDAYVWEQACKTIRDWMDKGKPCVPVSVNMSRVHLRDDSYMDVLDGLLEKYAIPQELLEIELTESSDEADLREKIGRLKTRGYTLLMDDFGSAYSSLNILKDTQFDTIKLDREFFRDFIDSQRGKEIIKHVIAMTQDIGLGVMAEGVETKEQAEFLLRCGCREAQGFYYARPMPVEEFNKLL